MLGTERRSMVLTEEDQRLSAYHEAGHALVAKRLAGGPSIGKATIIPRGQAMGMVSFLADERRSLTETRLKGHLATALGGCVAEKLVFSERSTGAQGDYQQVTKMARSMVCDWGMNETIGPLALGGDDDEVFLGKELARNRQISEETAQIVDREIRKLVGEAEEEAAADTAAAEREAAAKVAAEKASSETSTRKIAASRSLSILLAFSAEPLVVRPTGPTFWSRA